MKRMAGTILGVILVILVVTVLAVRQEFRRLQAENRRLRDANSELALIMADQTKLFTLTNFVTVTNYVNAGDSEMGSEQWTALIHSLADSNSIARGVARGVSWPIDGASNFYGYLEYEAAPDGRLIIKSGFDYRWR